MRLSFLLLGLISTSLCASEQQSTVHMLTSYACPIGFSARVDGRAVMHSIEDAREHGDAPLVELSFRHGGSPIVSANVTVHGWSRSDRFLPVSKSPDTNAAQSFQLVAGKSELSESVVRPDKVLFVDWAEVTELRYADGSVWQKSPYVQCRAGISKFRLVDATAQ